MGTRGIFGFKRNDEYKTTYHRFDAYLSFLGNCTFRLVYFFSDKELENCFDRLILVNENDVPDKKTVQKYLKLLTHKNYSFYPGPYESYEGLLNNVSNDISLYLRGVNHMIKADPYFHNYVDYSYLIDLDDKKIRVKGYAGECIVPFENVRRLESLEDIEYLLIEVSEIVSGLEEDDED